MPAINYRQRGRKNNELIRKKVSFTQTPKHSVQNLPLSVIGIEKNSVLSSYIIIMVQRYVKMF
jgi:hypothetical protein